MLSSDKCCRHRSERTCGVAVGAWYAIPPPPPLAQSGRDLLLKTDRLEPLQEGAPGLVRQEKVLQGEKEPPQGAGVLGKASLPHLLRCPQVEPLRRIEQSGDDRLLEGTVLQDSRPYQSHWPLPGRARPRRPCRVEPARQGASARARHVPAAGPWPFVPHRRDFGIAVFRTGLRLPLSQRCVRIHPASPRGHGLKRSRRICAIIPRGSGVCEQVIGQGPRRHARPAPPVCRLAGCRPEGRRPAFFIHRNRGHRRPRRTTRR